jgi:CBS domain-containing protein/nucleotide-binding universal stress UspA family protein
MCTGPRTAAAPPEALDEDPFVTRLMSSRIVGITPDSPLSTALRLMASTGVRHLPVVDGQRCLGLVTETDLARFVLDVPGAGVKGTALLVEALTRPTEPLPVTARRSDAARRMRAERTDAVLIAEKGPPGRDRHHHRPDPLARRRRIVTRPIVVFTRVATDRAALCWAAAEAGKRRVPLHVIVPESHFAAAEALDAARATVAELPVLGGIARGPAAETLHRMSAEAAALVLPAASPDLGAVLASAYCPVFVVPEGDAPSEAGTGPVVLGAAPWTREEVIDRAFSEAATRRAPLLVVQAGTPGPADREAQRLEMSLSVWRFVHPDVVVRAVVAPDRPADVLLPLTRGARLLVLGRSARGALLAGIVGSPVRDLLRAACCPVLVVPPDGPPHATLLPSRGHGWALSGG